MKKGTKIALIVATVLLTVGITGLIVSVSLSDFDLRMLNGAKERKETVNISEPFSDISVEADTEDIHFIKSSGDECKVVFSGDEKTRYTAKVKNNVLMISTKDTRKWYENIGFFWGINRKTKVYLPNDTYSAINVKLSTGDVKLNNISLNSLDLTASTGDITVKGVNCTGDIKAKVSTGDVHMTDIVCESLVSTGSTGDMALQNVVAKSSFDLKRSTGDIRFNGCDADEITVKTSTGDVTGSLLSDKIFLTETSTGDIKIPKTLSGGKCQIKTSTGDIILDVKHQ